MGISQAVLGVPGVWDGGGGLTLPDIASSAIFWVDAALGTYVEATPVTPAVNDNDLVGYWADQSGNSRHATRATDANKPTIQTDSVSGLPIVKGDGDDYLDIASMATLGDFTIISVHKWGADEDVILGDGNSLYWWYRHVLTGLYFNIANTAYGGAVAEAVDYNVLSIWVVRRENTTGVMRKNGADALTVSAFTFPTTTIVPDMLLSRRVALSNSVGAIGEMIMWNSAIADSNIALMEAWFAAKWSIPLA